jgi:hypothetical protein
MWLFWKTFLNLSYDSLALTPKPYIFSRMEQQLTPHATVRLLFVKCSELLSLILATSLGLLGHPTLLYQILSCGGSWKTMCSGSIMTIQELKVDKVATIDEDLRRYRYGNFQTRLQQCTDVNRGRLPDVICRKLACNVWVINSILGHTVEPRFTNWVHSWGPFVNRNVRKPKLFFP